MKIRETKDEIKKIKSFVLEIMKLKYEDNLQKIADKIIEINKTEIFDVD